MLQISTAKHVLHRRSALRVNTPLAAFSTMKAQTADRKAKQYQDLSGSTNRGNCVESPTRRKFTKDPPYIASPVTGVLRGSPAKDAQRPREGPP